MSLGKPARKLPDVPVRIAVLALLRAAIDTSVPVLEYGERQNQAPPLIAVGDGRPMDHGSTFDQHSVLYSMDIHCWAERAAWRVAADLANEVMQALTTPRALAVEGWGVLDIDFGQPISMQDPDTLEEHYILEVQLWLDQMS